MEDDIRFILESAILAPSAHNLQPWRFVVKDRTIELWSVAHLMSSGMFSAVEWDSYVAFGALVENASIAATTVRARLAVVYFPDKKHPDLIAKLTLVKDEKVVPDPLSSALRTRHTNRRGYERTPLSASERSALFAEAQKKRSLLLTEKDSDVEALARYESVYEELMFSNKPVHDYVFRRIRWTNRDTRLLNYGFTYPSLETPLFSYPAMQLFRLWQIIRYGRHLGLPQLLAAQQEFVHRKSAAFGAVVAESATPLGWLEAGRVFERIWLRATQLGLNLQPQTAALFLNFASELHPTSFTEEEHGRIKEAKQRVIATFGLTEKPLAVMFRIGHGPPATDRTTRIPLQSLMSEGGAEHPSRYLLSHNSGVQSKKTYAELRGEYLAGRKRKDLTFDLLMEYGEVAIRVGRLGQAAEIMQEALKAADDPLQKAFVYLQLARIEHLKIRLHADQRYLTLAFEALGLPYPRGTFAGVVVAFGMYIRALFSFFLQMFWSPAEKERLHHNLSAELYIETGFTSYYVGNISPVLECVLYSHSFALLDSPTNGMVFWYVGAGSLCAALGFKRMSRFLLKRAFTVAQSNRTVRAVATSLMWQGALADFFGDPESALVTLHELQQKYNDGLLPQEKTVVSASLAVNYTVRGNPKAAIGAVDFLLQEYDKEQGEVEDHAKAYVEWQKITALSFLGIEHELRAILERSEDIFNAPDTDKWTQSNYTADLLTQHYISDELDLGRIGKILLNFDSLGLTPSTSYRVSLHYWVSRAYIFLALHKRGKVDRSLFDKAVSDLRSARHHALIYPHTLLLLGHQALLDGKPTLAREYVVRALKGGTEYDNLWVDYEAKKLDILVEHAFGQKDIAIKKLKDLEQEVFDRGWNGCNKHLTSLRDEITS
jgi:nitroreductase